MSTLWSADDVEALASLCGDLPWPLVLKTFNRNRQHKRTETALRRKAESLGLLRACVGQFVTPGVLVEALGTSYERVRRWTESGELPCVRFGGTRSHPRWIRRADLRAFARRRPEVFGGLSEAELVQLLCGEQLARELAERQMPRERLRYPVECIDTGGRWPSIGAAARAAYVTKQRMRHAVRHGGLVNGRRYRLVE